MNKDMEMAQLLVRFRLQVKRSLSQSIDLERLRHERAYAQQRLDEIEASAPDQELLGMVLRLREHLLPVEAEISQAEPTREIRNYLMGARAW